MYGRLLGKGCHVATGGHLVGSHRRQLLAVAHTPCALWNPLSLHRVATSSTEARVVAIRHRPSHVVVQLTSLPANAFSTPPRDDALHHHRGAFARCCGLSPTVHRRWTKCRRAKYAPPQDERHAVQRWITKPPLRHGHQEHEVDHETAVGWITIWVPLKLPSSRHFSAAPERSSELAHRSRGRGISAIDR